MAHLNDFAERFKLGHASASPFTPMARAWCIPCRQDVDVVAEAQHRGTTYLFKRICKRCGTVLQHGVFQNVPLIHAEPLSADVVRWTREGLR